MTDLSSKGQSFFFFLTVIFADRYHIDFIIYHFDHYLTHSKTYWQKVSNTPFKYVKTDCQIANCQVVIKATEL